MKLTKKQFEKLQQVINNQHVLDLIKNHELEDVIYLFKILSPDSFDDLEINEQDTLNKLIKFKFRELN